MTSIPFQKNINVLLHISVGLAGPLQTAFELKNDLEKTKVQPDATALTDISINLLKIPKTRKYFYGK